MATTTNGTGAAHTNGTDHGPAGVGAGVLRETWAIRNAATQTLLLAEAQMERVIRAASLPELIALIEEFFDTGDATPHPSPARNASPDHPTRPRPS